MLLPFAQALFAAPVVDEPLVASAELVDAVVLVPSEATRAAAVAELAATGAFVPGWGPLLFAAMVARLLAVGPPVADTAAV